METQCALCVRNATQTVDVVYNGHATRLAVCDVHARELAGEEAFQAKLKHYREKRDAWAKDNDDLYGRSA